MKWNFKLVKRALGHGGRALSCAAIIVKLLVPVGYMPAALASGAPIRLCDGYLPRALQLPAEQVAPTAHGMAHGHGGHREHEHEHEHSWEHCSLGALASAAAIAPDWPLVDFSSVAARIEVAEQGIPTSSTSLVVRARGPPTHA
jgi:hypothetical protein